MNISAYLNIWLYAFAGILNRNKKLPSNSVIIVHGYGVRGHAHGYELRKNSGSLSHAYTALEIHRRNKEQVAFVITSGFDSNPDLTESEGAYMAEYLIQQGLPPELLLIEEHALTTPENIARSLLLLKKRGADIHKYNFVSIHHPFYLWKTFYISKILGIKIFPIAAHCPIAPSIVKAQHSRVSEFFKDPFEIAKAEKRATSSHNKIEALSSEDFLSSINKNSR